MDGGKWDDMPYDIYSGGSGASMRNPCFGLAFFGQENRYKLIQIAIETSRITHNSVVGYLGGLASALFIALAIENVDVKRWPFELLKLFEDNIIAKYIKKSDRGYESYMRDAHVFIEKWKRYIEDKFDDAGNPIKRKSSINLVYRGKYYHETFGFKYEGSSHLPHKSEENGFIGSGGDDSVIIAYDCLLDAGKNWEKLVIYSMMHIGDTDTTGAIAASMYGALYGFDGVPENFLEHLEYKKELIHLGKNLYKKYNNV
jgi:ADP-ribosylglycohydrolase